MSSVDFALQVAQTTGNGSEYDLKFCNRATFYLTGNGTTSSGVITCETADVSQYSGTWAPIGTTTAATAISGGKQAIVQVVGPLRFVRARISTDIGGGGSVSASVIATS